MHAQAPGLPRQHKERGLEGVVGIGGIAQQPPADRQHHRTMSPHHGRERFFIALAHEAIEQLAVAALGPRQFGEIAAVENPQDRMSHSSFSSSVPIHYSPPSASLIHS